MLVLNKDSLKAFLDEFYPTATELVHLQVFARKKYNNSLAASETPLLNTFVYPTFETVVLHLTKLELTLHLYKDKKGKEFPADSLVVYMGTKAVDLKEASFKMANALNDAWYKGSFQNPEKLAKTVMSTCHAKSVWSVFDLDVPSLDLNRLTEALGNDTCYRVTKTRGGFHVWVNTTQTTNMMWYKMLSKLEGFDTKVDLTPVWGCTQGGFEVTRYQ